MTCPSSSVHNYVTFINYIYCIVYTSITNISSSNSNYIYISNILINVANCINTYFPGVEYNYLYSSLANLINETSTISTDTILKTEQLLIILLNYLQIIKSLSTTTDTSNYCEFVICFLNSFFNYCFLDCFNPFNFNCGTSTSTFSKVVSFVQCVLDNISGTSDCTIANALLSLLILSIESTILCLNGTTCTGFNDQIQKISLELTNLFPNLNCKIFGTPKNCFFTFCN